MKTILIIAIAITSVFSSCKKGCIDPKAVNYDESAKSDPGDLCTYEASLVCWFSQSTADTLTATYPLDVWMGGSSVATWNQTDAIASEPGTCAAGTGVAVLMKSGKDQVYTSSITIWDANQNKVGDFFAQSFDGGECKKVKF